MTELIQWNITDTPEAELLLRRSRVLAELSLRDLEGMVFFDAYAIRYLAGAVFFPTERPIALVLRHDGETGLMVPRMEYEHAQVTAKAINRLICYKEYPGEKNPMHDLAGLLGQMGLASAALAADAPTYPAFCGSRCPELSGIMPSLRLTLLPLLVEELKIIKSDFDLACIRESARWATVAMSLLQEYTRPGMREVDVVNRACHDATQMMLKALGPDFVPAVLNSDSAGAVASYRGQIGAHSFFPHSMSTNAAFRQGDSVLGESWSLMLEYLCELERVMFVGEPGSEQLKYYSLVVAAQDVALGAMAPGRTCGEVDAEVTRFYEEQGLMPYWRHHTGHSLGFMVHERPFLDVNDHTVLAPGMVFSVEPGLYVEGLGGFRCSDTVAIHEKGVEQITYYPRTVDKLICG